MLFYPTAIGWHPPKKAEYGAAQHDAGRLIQRSHAIANGVFVRRSIASAIEGPSDGGLEFWGGSFVADPFGRILGRAHDDREESLVVRLRSAR